MLPDQIIDYTYGREMTLFDNLSEPLVHVDFSWPFDVTLRNALKARLGAADLHWNDGGCYGATQGPRLETAAEIQRLARDGNDMVGMTAMPEAALAREAGLDYASVCLVVNPGAGLSDTLITMEDIQAVIDTGMLQVKSLLAQCILSHG